MHSLEQEARDATEEGSVDVRVKQAEDVAKGRQSDADSIVDTANWWKDLKLL